MGAWPSIDPGKMVHQVSIMQKRASVDRSGAVTQWVPFVQTWAQIDPMKGTDVLKGGQDTTQTFVTIKIRWQTGIQPNMRVQGVNGLYLIQSIQNEGERNVVLTLTCIALGLNA